jgi:hypothetical protein
MEGVEIRVESTREGARRRQNPTHRRARNQKRRERGQKREGKERERESERVRKGGKQHGKKVSKREVTREIRKKRARPWIACQRGARARVSSMIPGVPLGNTALASAAWPCRIE